MEGAIPVSRIFLHWRGVTGKTNSASCNLSTLFRTKQASLAVGTVLGSFEHLVLVSI